MDETKPEAEAWVRKKPKRIIHNQTVIQILMMLNIALPLTVPGVVLWLVFCLYPQIVIPAILTLWLAGSVAYVALRVHVKRQNKKS
jgi:hypothetical protein